MEQFDPTSASAWTARGRSAGDAEALASIWRDYPDLPPTAPSEERLMRCRARIAAMRPMHEAAQAEQERARRARNFAFVEGKAADGTIDDRDLAILRARDAHGFDWNEAVRYAEGWYAARAGWSYRERMPHLREEPTERAAYDVGFRDGGGDRTDLFDAARRAFIAAAPSNIVDSKAPATRPGRLPSTWPKPSDAPRPVRWSRRLAILAPEDLIAREQGGSGLGIDVLKHEDQGLTVIVFRQGQWETPSGVQLAAEDLQALLRAKELEDILTTIQGDELERLDAATMLLPIVGTCERAQNSLLQRRAHVRTWLSRGVANGQNAGAGHIRWGKAAKGLRASLGEFTAIDRGSISRGSHAVAVLLEDGSPANGFVDALGAPLDPIICFSNRAQLRCEMEKALRAFGGGTRLSIGMMKPAVATYSGNGKVTRIGGST
ncbi:hypothetical protein [Sphingomonas sp. 22176]|uniref:hypothetical protein n=1 Tax=Sphingomonas sp. 22176 TaxID=3453884 RepID=UPI003F82BE73